MVKRRALTAVEKVGKTEILWATAGWLGSYEGVTGTLEDLVAEGATDEHLVADPDDGGEGIPADIVAAYKRAFHEAREYQTRLARNNRDRLRKQAARRGETLMEGFDS